MLLFVKIFELTFALKYIKGIIVKKENVSIT